MNYTYYKMHNDFYSIGLTYALYIKLGQVYMREIDWYNINMEILYNI